MAEAIVAISLVASVLQLVDFGSKLVGRLRDFSASTKEVPETFRTISVQLPLAIATLERIQIRIKNDELPEAEAEALKALIDHSVDLVKDLDHILERLMPSKSCSPLEKQILAVRSLRHDKKVHNASVCLLQNVHLIIFHQSANIQDVTRDLSKAISVVSGAQPAAAANLSYGLNLGHAPRIADGTFVGREAEMKQLRRMLDPASQRQNVVSVVGMGGTGKTQLCIEYAISHQDQYSSVFWLNAQDESSLRADLVNLSQIILPDQESSLTARAEEDGLVQKIRRWLSHSQNRHWLLIFDNFDNPKVPGTEDPNSYDIREYFPQRLQGSILLTTRSRKVTYARQIPLQKLENVEQGLEILSGRSGRCFTDDVHATDLVKRLDGLPLALASAASFLSRTSCTAKEYLEDYERNWLEEEEDSLYEYGDRTLFTTWNLSFDTLKRQSPEAAEMLRILAFFGPESIDYRLFVAQKADLWPSLGETLNTKASFDRSMARLRDFSLVEASDRSYRLHPCLHDWTLSNLNRNLDEEDVWLALNCIVFNAESDSSIWSTKHDETLSRIASHALRLTHPRLLTVLMQADLDEWRSAALCGLGQLLHRADRNPEAEQLVRRSLSWVEKSLGVNHEDTLGACNVLGLIYEGLQDFGNAETYLKKAALGFETTVGRDDRRTLDPVHNLALLYSQMDRLDDAEQMYVWSLRGCEKSYGLADPNTFWAAMALADFYMAKGDLDDAEREFGRALNGFDQAIDRDHYFVRYTARRLGTIYRQQGKVEAAEMMYQRVHESCERTLGRDHWITQEAYDDLTSLKSEQNITVTQWGYHNDIKPSNILMTKLDTSYLGSDVGVDKGSLLGQHSTQPSRLCCHECKVTLTRVTQRFICCVCADHELCGKCYNKTRIGGMKNKTLDHPFLRCGFADTSDSDQQFLDLGKPFSDEKRPLFIMGTTGAGKSTFPSYVAELQSKTPSVIAYKPTPATNHPVWYYDLMEDVD